MRHDSLETTWARDEP